MESLWSLFWDCTRGIKYTLQVHRKKRPRSLISVVLLNVTGIGSKQGNSSSVSSFFWASLPPCGKRLMVFNNGSLALIGLSVCVFDFLLTLNWNSHLSSEKEFGPFWPRLRQGYPLNLSISLSGGKETNKDSPSNGEWSGKSSSLKPVSLCGDTGL